MTLRRTIATPDGKRRYVRRLFSTIAERYDFITSALSYGQDRRWKRRLIALARIERRPPRLDLAAYPHLPKLQVKTTRAADYAALVPELAA